MEKDHCETCGAKLKRYNHPMTPILVHALVKFYAAVCAKKENSIHLKDDMDGTDQELDRYERSNWTKLRFHGLVAKVKENNHQVRGCWLITHRGADFLKGELSIPKTVYVYRNNVVGRSEDLVSVRDVIASIPYVQSIDDIVFESPTEEEVVETVKKISTKIKTTCPKCGGKMKTKLMTDSLDSNTVKVIKLLVCPDCQYEKPDEDQGNH